MAEVDLGVGATRQPTYMERFISGLESLAPDQITEGFPQDGSDFDTPQKTPEWVGSVPKEPPSIADGMIDMVAPSLPFYGVLWDRVGGDTVLTTNGKLLGSAIAVLIIYQMVKK